MTSDLQLLQLMRLVSPALPVGAFAYSQGLEGAIEQGWIANESESHEWISAVLTQNIASLDMPALFWQLEALRDRDTDQFIDFNKTIFALRETSELRLESRQMGAALLKLLRDTEENIEPTISKILFDENFKGTQNNIDWVSAFALASRIVNLSPNQAILGYGWAWCETQVAAAIKLVPLGQTQGQKILNQLIDTLADLVQSLMKEMPSKDEIGAISPNLAIISSLHEQQYSRLFRS